MKPDKPLSHAHETPSRGRSQSQRDTPSLPHSIAFTLLRKQSQGEGLGFLNELAKVISVGWENGTEELKLRKFPRLWGYLFVQSRTLHPIPARTTLGVQCAVSHDTLYTQRRVAVQFSSRYYAAFAKHYILCWSRMGLLILLEYGIYVLFINDVRHRGLDLVKLMRLLDFSPSVIGVSIRHGRLYVWICCTKLYCHTSDIIFDVFKLLTIS